MNFWMVAIAKRFDAMQFTHALGVPALLKTEEEPHWYVPLFESRATAVAWNEGREENVYALRQEGP